MKTVYVLGSRYNACFLPDTFTETVKLSYSHLPTEETKAPELLLFVGGIDLCPETYGKKYAQVYGSSERDTWESAWFHWAVKHGVPMFGICRGMQLFTALTGGELIPHVGRHIGTHEVTVDGNMWEGPNKFLVNSIHHQMCVPGEHTELLAWAEGVAFSSALSVKEPEALWFPKVKALGVQWHPEMLNDGHREGWNHAKVFVNHIMRRYLNV